MNRQFISKEPIMSISLNDKKRLMTKLMKMSKKFKNDEYNFHLSFNNLVV